MASPHYSIVVPTRNRAQTLRACLQTCLSVDYDDYEVIVSDNHSSDETPQVVADFDSSKIKYVRSDRPLSMCKNWELALAQTSGEWVTFIGDDDGILPSAFKQLDRTIPQVDVRCMHFESASYIWPTPDLPALSDYLKIPLRRSVTILDAHDTIRQVLAARTFVGALPGPYHGLTHRSLIEKALRVSGRVFLGWVPDHISGFTFAYLGKRYARIDFPITVVGHSPKSNGGAVLRTVEAHPEFYELIHRDGLEFHPWTPSPVIDHISGYFNPFLLTKERYFPDDDDLKVSRKEVLTQIVRWYAQHQRYDWEKAIGALRKSLVDEPALLQWFEQHVRQEWETTQAVPYVVSVPKGSGYKDECLHLNGADFGIRDIADAVAFCEKITGLKANPVDYVAPPPPAQGRLDRAGLPRPVIKAIRTLASLVRG